MANVSITAANVAPSTGARTRTATAGATVTAGQTVYKKAADGKYYLADCDATAVAANAEIDHVYGIAINNAAATQPLTIQYDGLITIGGTVVVGTAYFQSATAGGICPHADLVATDHATLIGVGSTTGAIEMSINITDKQIA